MKIRAAISASAEAPFEIAEVELDDPRRDEVLVELRAVGVCHSDLTMKAVWPEAISPIVLGHEGAGVVAAVGADVTGVRPGDHVVLSYRSCGACRAVRGRAPAVLPRLPHAERDRLAPGRLRRPCAATARAVYGSYFGQSSFASHALAYESNVVVVGEEIDLGVAAPLGCGVQTGAGTVLNVLAPPPEASLVVFGAGGVGLSAVMAASASGVGTIIAVDPGREPPAARGGARRERDDRPGRRRRGRRDPPAHGCGGHARDRHDREGRGHQPGDRRRWRRSARSRWWGSTCPSSR